MIEDDLAIGKACLGYWVTKELFSNSTLLFEIIVPSLLLVPVSYHVIFFYDSID